MDRTPDCLRVLIVEDNYSDYLTLKGEMERRLPNVEFERISTEWQFLQKFEGIAQAPPHVIVVDMMLRWREAHELLPDETSPKDDFRGAGLRVLERLSTDNRTESVPVLLCSNVLQEHLRTQISATHRNVFLATKDAVAGAAASIVEADPCLSRLGIKPQPQFEYHKVFISYSYHDRRLVDQIKTHLAPLMDNRPITLWDDSKLMDGQWRSQLEEQMGLATIALFVVTANFCASNFVKRIELDTLLKRHKEAGCKISWIAAGPALYEAIPLGSFQCLNDPKHPLSTLTPAHRETVLNDIARKLQLWLDLKPGV